jgi:transposase-like protein
MDLKQLIEKLSTDERKELLHLLQVEINAPKFVTIHSATHTNQPSNSTFNHTLFINTEAQRHGESTNSVPLSLCVKTNLDYTILIAIWYHKDEAVRCPHSSSGDIYGHGAYKGRRRYRCKSCQKSFNDCTGTAVSGIKKTEKFEEYLNLMVESLTIRKASACLGVNMKTVFDWRHKILSSLSAFNGESLAASLSVMTSRLTGARKGVEN